MPPVKSLYSLLEGEVTLAIGIEDAAGTERIAYG
jgi:hypothetical protein